MHIKTAPEPEAIFEALAHTVRLEIVAMLLDGEQCVCDIASNLHRDRTVISRHLLILEQAGILFSRKEGRRVFYKIADERVVELIRICLKMVEEPKRG